MKHKLIIAYKGGNEEKWLADLLRYVCEFLLNNVLEIKVTPYKDGSNYDIYLCKVENKIFIRFEDAGTTLDFPPKNTDVFLSNIENIARNKTFTYNNNDDKEKLVTLLLPIALHGNQFHDEQYKDTLRFFNTQSIHDFFRDTQNPVHILSKSKVIIFFTKSEDNDSEKDIRLKIYSWIDFLVYIEDIDYKKFYFYSDSDMSLPWALPTLESRGAIAQRHESNNLKKIERALLENEQIIEREKENKTEKHTDFNKDEYTKEINIKPRLVPKNTLNELKVALENEIIKYVIRKKLYDKDKDEIIKFNNHTFAQKYDVNVLNNFKGITELVTEVPEDILFSYIEVNDIDRLLLYLKDILGEGQDKF